MSVVVVTWILILLAVFGLNHSRDALQESRAVAHEIERHQLRACAWSGVELARAVLEETPLLDCAELVQWSPDNPLAGTRSCGSGRFAVGRILSFGDFEQWMPGLEDEAARLPLAVADSTSLALVPGMTRHGVESILRARDTAGEHMIPPFTMLGLDDPSLAAAGQYLSRYGDVVNINSAPAEILRAVGLPGSAVDKLLDWRAGSDRALGTGDDQRFPGLASDSEPIRQCGLNSEEAAVLALLRSMGRIGVTSRHYRLAAYGWGYGLDGLCEIRAVLEIPESDQVQIVAWSEHWLN